jgi:D-alanyl-D-alanine carboxypeptidase
MRPFQRRLPGAAPELIAAIEETVGSVVSETVSAEVAEGLVAPAPRPSAVAPEAVAAALNEALEPEVAQGAQPALEEPDRGPMPRPEPQSAVAVSPRPVPAEPEVVTRASSTGSRLYGVSLGRQPSHHAAERLLLRTALAELGTFDEALRRVVQRSGGYEARFAGMTEHQAERACARLAARNMSCETFGP